MDINITICKYIASMGENFEKLEAAYRTAKAIQTITAGVDYALDKMIINSITHKTLKEFRNHNEKFIDIANKILQRFLDSNDDIIDIDLVNSLLETEKNLISTWNDFLSASLEEPHNIMIEMITAYLSSGLAFCTMVYHDINDRTAEWHRYET